MAPTAAQFSPGQILEAGRRAENDGRIGYALQFYRHLTDHHARTPEAAIAKEALSRLAHFRPEATTGQPAPAAAPALDRDTTQPHQNGGWQPQPNGAPASGQAASIAARQVAWAAPPHTQQPQAVPGVSRVSSASTAAPLRLPPAEQRYRVGRAVAWLLIVAGLTLMAASVMLLALHGTGIKLPGTLGMLLGFTGGIPGAAALFTVGVTQVFAAQIGRALFDSANATRDLAMIERAKIAHAAGDPLPGDDDDEPE
jgi:hypothetical protein